MFEGEDYGYMLSSLWALVWEVLVASPSTHESESKAI